MLNFENGTSHRLYHSSKTMLKYTSVKICVNKKKIEYPTELIYSEFNVPTIEILYQIKLLAYYHKNYTKFKSNQHIYSRLLEDSKPSYR